jgi:hypothetical protein
MAASWSSTTRHPHVTDDIDADLDDRAMSPRSARHAEAPSARVTSPTSALVGALVGGFVGFLLNLMPVSVINGSSLIFGGVAILTIALRFGGPAGALAAAIGAFPTVQLWETPITWMLAVIDAYLMAGRCFASSWALHRVQLIIWLVIGIPIILLWYLGIRETTGGMAAIIAVKSVVNAVLCLSLARVIAVAPRFWGGARPGHDPQGRSLRDYLVGAAAIAIAIPTLLSVVLLVEVVQQNQRRLEAERVQQLALGAASTISGIMNERMAGIVAAARQLGVSGESSAPLAQSILDATGPARQSFITMLVTDSLGDFVAGYATDTAVVAALRRDRFNVADREYFRRPRDTRSVYVSDVFIGRGFGRDRIIAMSAPIVGPQGQFLGVVEGSMATDQLQEFLGAVPDGYEVLLLSGAGQVIVWGDSTPPPSMERIEVAWGPVLSTRPVKESDPAVRTVRLERRDEPRIPIAAQTRLVSEVPGPFGWEIVSRRSLAEADAGIQTMVRLTLLGSLAVFLLMRLIFGRVLRDVLEPLAVIETAVGETPMDGDTPIQPLEPRISIYAPRELAALAEGFDSMSAALSARFA